MIRKAVLSVVGGLVSVGLLASPALADTLHNRVDSYSYAKGYSKSTCRGGHITPVYPGRTEHGLKAFKLQSGTVALWSWYNDRGERVGWKKLRSPEKCHKLHGNHLRDEVYVTKG